MSFILLWWVLMNCYTLGTQHPRLREAGFVDRALICLRCLVAWPYVMYKQFQQETEDEHR